MSLGQNDLERVSRFLLELYGETEAEHFAGLVRNGLLRLIECDLFGYDEIDARSNRTLSIVEPFVPEVLALNPELEARLEEHPQLRHFRLTQDTTCYQTTDLISHRQFHELGIYRDFYRHIGAEHQLTCAISEPGAGLDIGISLNRKLKRFSDREQSMLNFLRPHLAQAHRNMVAANGTRDREQVLASGLEALRAGVAQLDPEGRVLWLTSRAEDCLRGYFPPGLTPLAFLPGLLRCWERQKRAELRGGAVPNAPIAPLVVAQDRGRLSVYYYAAAGGAARLVFQEERPVCRQTAIRDLGLTRREAEVAHRLIEGKTDPEIGILLGGQHAHRAQTRAAHLRKARRANPQRRRP